MNTSPIPGLYLTHISTDTDLILRDLRGRLHIATCWDRATTPLPGDIVACGQDNWLRPFVPSADGVLPDAALDAQLFEDVTRQGLLQVIEPGTDQLREIYRVQAPRRLLDLVLAGVVEVATRRFVLAADWQTAYDAERLHAARSGLPIVKPTGMPAGVVFGVGVLGPALAGLMLDTPTGAVIIETPATRYAIGDVVQVSRPSAKDAWAICKLDGAAAAKIKADARLAKVKAMHAATCDALPSAQIIQFQPR